MYNIYIGVIVVPVQLNGARPRFRSDRGIFFRRRS